MRNRVLIAIALFFSAYLCTALTALGLDKFGYILAGGRKFATFPSLGIQIGIGASYLILSLLYLLWFFGTKRLYSYSRFWHILMDTAVFWLLAFIAYPLGNDVYLYLHAGLMNLSQINPFLVRAANFTSELSPFVDWGQTSTYGPISQLLFTLCAASISVHPLLGIYSFKLICLVLHLFNGYVIWRSLDVPDRSKIVLAYLLHPLLLMEQVSSAHVDVLVSTSVVMLGLSLKQKQEAAGVLSLWAGLLSKTIPVIWLPLTGVFLLRQRRWGQVWAGLGVSIVLVAALTLTVLPGIPAWSSLLNPGVAGQYHSSLHAIGKFGLDLVRIFSPDALSFNQQRDWLLLLSRFTLAVFAGFYAWSVWRIGRSRTATWEMLMEQMGWVTLVLLLVATPWLMPWYASVLITIAALIPRAQLFGLTSLMFALSSSAQYLLQGHNSFKALVAIGIPLLTLLLGSKLFAPRSVSISDRTTSTAGS